MRGFSLYWWNKLLEPSVVGDMQGAMGRSIILALMVMVITALFATMLAMAFRKSFMFSNVLFYTVLTGLMVPGVLLSLGMAILMRQLGLSPAWYTSGLAVHVVWALPFGYLVMMAVFNRFDSGLEEAARDMGADEWTVFREVTLPLITPGVVAAGLFGFTLSYDEFARTLQTAGPLNTLPLEIWSMTLNVTSPSLYALGTVSTVVSFLIIGISLGSIALIQRQRAAAARSGE